MHFSIEKDFEKKKAKEKKEGIKIFRVSLGIVSGSQISLFCFY